MKRLLWVCLVSLPLFAKSPAPPFSVLNCKPTGDEKRPCKRLDWPSAKAYLIFNEVLAAEELQHGKKPTVIDPWLELGTLTADEIEQCNGDSKGCAISATTFDKDGRPVSYRVRMAEWDEKLGDATFVAAWLVLCDRAYDIKLTAEQRRDMVKLVLANVYYRVQADSLKQAHR